jgi:protease-4
VWSGEDALQIGLVDHLGSLEEATEAVAKLAGLEPGEYQLMPMEPEHDFTTRLLSRFSGSIRFESAFPGASLLARELRRQPSIVSALSWLNDPQGMYAHCFCTPSMGGRSKVH